MRALITRDNDALSIYGSDSTDLDHAREPTANELAEYGRRAPVELRVGAVLSAIPRSIARKGVPFSYIQGQLAGRSRGALTCGNAELGRALVRRGWQRRRTWERREKDGALTLWFPPGVDPVHESIIAKWKLPPGRPPKWLARARQLARESGIVF